MIKSWSFSSLLNFERCPYSVTFPFKQTESEHARRGTEIHKNIAEYLRNPNTKSTWSDDGRSHSNLDFSAIRSFPLRIEERFGFDRDFTPVPYREGWLKIIPDLVVDQPILTVIDYKTGKSENNEIKHIQQLQLYLCALVSVFLDKEGYQGKVWYIDEDKEKPTQIYSKTKLLAMRERWALRGHIMTSTTHFPAKPSKSNCRFCVHNTECEFAYETL